MDLDLDRIRDRRSIEDLIEFGIVNLDKPSGPTSFRAASMTGNILDARKSCHYGTLDPKVTGVLPVGLNRACRLAQWFLKKDKTYEGVMRLHRDVPLEEVEWEMRDFRGVIEQVPPVRSRVKRQAREREVYRWQITDAEGRDLRFVAEVEAGTYIRKLVHDLGQRIGGAHMLGLRRTHAGPFGHEDESFVTLEQLERAVQSWRKGEEKPLRRALVPGEAIGRMLPVIRARGECVEELLHGVPVRPDHLQEPSDLPEGEDFVILSDERGLIEVARVVDEPDILARPQFVRN